MNINDSQYSIISQPIRFTKMNVHAINLRILTKKKIFATCYQNQMNCEYGQHEKVFGPPSHARARRKGIYFYKLVKYDR